MDGSDLMLTTPMMPPSPLENAAGGGLTGAAGNVLMSGAKPAEAKKTEQLAKDFESVLLTQLVDKMKDTVDQWGCEEEAGAGQVKGLFWLFLARDVADKGGLGLWKDLSRFFTDLQNKGAPAQLLDENL
jgi:Rod binding domain-containing protein